MFVGPALSQYKGEAEAEGSLDAGLWRATRFLAALDECVAEDENRYDYGGVMTLLTVLLGLVPIAIVGGCQGFIGGTVPRLRGGLR